MARQTDTTDTGTPVNVTQDQVVNATPGFQNTPTENQGPSFMGPFDRTGATAPLGMTGKQRFDWVVTSNPQLSTMRSHDWDNWMMSLPEDPNDMEYTRLLRQEKTDAASRERVRSETRNLGTQPSITAPAGKIKTDGGEVVKFQGSTPDARNATALLSTDSTAGPAGTLPFTWPPDGIATGTANPNAARQGERAQKELDARDTGEQQRKYREKIADKPIIMGLQVSDNEALVGSPDNPGGTPDGYISEWAHKQGLSLDNEHAQRAARNGSWVYQGEVADVNGGPGFTRAVYVHVDDAISQLSGLSVDQIKSYQHMLKNPETGIVDTELHNLWKEAVARASDYARQGKKVTLDFIFQQLLGAKVKGGGGGGGGGGAGGRFGNESGADMVGADYYQSMIQVLGDISGVKK